MRMLWTIMLMFYSEQARRWRTGLVLVAELSWSHYLYIVARCIYMALSNFYFGSQMCILQSSLITGMSKDPSSVSGAETVHVPISWKPFLLYKPGGAC